jgi:hypothetical protein
VQRITGPTLDRVKRILDAEGPASGITEFPDAILEQHVDVGRMVAGFGLEDGWVWYRDVVTMASTGNAFSSTNVGQILGLIVPEPSPRRDVALWLMQCSLAYDPDGVATNDLEMAEVALDMGIFGSVPASGSLFTIARSGALAGDDRQITSGGVILGRNPDVHPPLPILMSQGASILHHAALSVFTLGVAESQASLLFWCGPRGLNPPGVA